MSDSGDNPTAGASSDSTELLTLLINDSRVQALHGPVIYAGIYDPIATTACENQVGKEVTLIFGSKFDSRHSKPITAQGKVKAYVKNWGAPIYPPGDMALFHTKGVDVILDKTHVGYTETTMFEALGLDAEKAALVVCKLSYLTPAHEQLAKRSILVLTKGNTDENLASLSYEKVVRPIYPIDLDLCPSHLGS